MANRVAGVDSDRAVRYGSMMASAVPATGTLRVAARNATPLHRAEALSKQQPSSRHAPSSSRKTLATCQAKITASMGKWLSRAEPPINSGKKERCAGDMKNSAPKGYRDRKSTRLNSSHL